MPEMSNLETLLEAGAIADLSHISDEHKNIINTRFTAEEIQALIKLKNEITGLTFASDPGSGDRAGMAAV